MNAKAGVETIIEELRGAVEDVLGMTYVHENVPRVIQLGKALEAAWEVYQAELNPKISVGDATFRIEVPAWFVKFPELTKALEKGFEAQAAQQQNLDIIEGAAGIQRSFMTYAELQEACKNPAVQEMLDQRIKDVRRCFPIREGFEITPKEPVVLTIPKAPDEAVVHRTHLDGTVTTSTIKLGKP